MAVVGIRGADFVIPQICSRVSLSYALNVLPLPTDASFLFSTILEGQLWPHCLPDGFLELSSTQNLFASVLQQLKPTVFSFGLKRHLLLLICVLFLATNGSHSGVRTRQLHILVLSPGLSLQHALHLRPSVSLFT